MSRAKSAREVQEGGSYGGSEGGSSLKSAKPGGIFKVIFQGLFFGKKIFRHVFGVLNKKDLWVRTFNLYALI